jgi:hypothetical protein
MRIKGMMVKIGTIRTKEGEEKGKNMDIDRSRGREERIWRV